MSRSGRPGITHVTSTRKRRSTSNGHACMRIPCGRGWRPEPWTGCGVRPAGTNNAVRSVCRLAGRRRKRRNERRTVIVGGKSMARPLVAARPRRGHARSAPTPAGHRDHPRLRSSMSPEGPRYDPFGNVPCRDDRFRWCRSARPPAMRCEPYRFVLRQTNSLRPRRPGLADTPDL
jgi:hypothetical protein